MEKEPSYNPDTSGTHPNSQPIGPKQAQTMAEALGAFPTAVRVMSDGSLESIHDPRPEPVAKAFVLDTRLINGEPSLCAIAPDGTILHSRGLGNSSSHEIYGLVEDEAQRILDEQV